MQGWGRGFDNLPPLPPENDPRVVGGGEERGGVTRTSESRTAIILSGVSLGEPNLQYVDYVPYLVPRGTRSASKRARVDGSSTSMSVPKKPRRPSTRPSTQNTCSMLLGERIIILSCFSFYFFFLI
jgi:hypothetical protein